MEYKLKKDRIAVCETSFDSFTELPVESDLLLPDYCPDIVKVLKCQARPAFSKTEVSGDKCILEGATAITVYYTGEDGQLHSSEHKVDFSKTLELKATPQRPVVFCSIKEDYLNCKAVNQRRVDVRGAFTVTVKILSMAEQEIISAAEGAGLQLSCQPMSSSELVGTAGKKFTVREDLELGVERPPMDYIIRHSEKIRAAEWKVTGGKVIVKGELEIFLEYRPRDGGARQSVSYQLPVSQMLDVEGAGDECLCQVRFELLWSALHPLADADGMTNAASGEFILGVYCMVLREKKALPAIDAYSTQYELQFSQKPASLLQVLEGLPQAFELEQAAQLPDYLKETMDFWCETGALSVLAQEQVLLISGKLRYCMLGLDADGTPAYFEQIQEVAQEYPLAVRADGYLPQLSVAAEDCQYEIQEKNKLKCRCRLKVDGIILAVKPASFITGIKLDETREKKREDQSAMTIYYADAGENIWSIAKRYNTSIMAVMEENGLEDEILQEKRIVLIPMVG
ncbi:MAG: DUF3794 domain-containing protein [Oscillospiraceae bacterium]|nr:DUF3794 domain-containing protein [Oscillospiraceae bacterium]